MPNMPAIPNLETPRHEVVAKDVSSVYSVAGNTVQQLGETAASTYMQYKELQKQQGHLANVHNAVVKNIQDNQKELGLSDDAVAKLIKQLPYDPNDPVNSEKGLLVIGRNIQALGISDAPKGGNYDFTMAPDLFDQSLTKTTEGAARTRITGGTPAQPTTGIPTGQPQAPAAQPTPPPTTVSGGSQEPASPSGLPSGTPRQANGMVDTDAVVAQDRQAIMDANKNSAAAGVGVHSLTAGAWGPEPPSAQTMPNLPGSAAGATVQNMPNTMTTPSGASQASVQPMQNPNTIAASTTQPSGDFTDMMSSIPTQNGRTMFKAAYNAYANDPKPSYEKFYANYYKILEKSYEEAQLQKTQGLEANTRLFGQVAGQYQISGKDGGKQVTLNDIANGDINVGTDRLPAQPTTQHIYSHSDGSKGANSGLDDLANSSANIMKAIEESSVTPEVKNMLMGNVSAIFTQSAQRQGFNVQTTPKVTPADLEAQNWIQNLNDPKNAKELAKEIKSGRYQKVLSQVMSSLNSNAGVAYTK
jgi:hypothetical protein